MEQTNCLIPFELIQNGSIPITTRFFNLIFTASRARYILRLLTKSFLFLYDVQICPSSVIYTRASRIDSRMLAKFSRSQIAYETGSRICLLLSLLRFAKCTQKHSTLKRDVYYKSLLHVNDYRGYHASIITYFYKVYDSRAQ